MSVVIIGGNRGARVHLAALACARHVVEMRPPQANEPPYQSIVPKATAEFMREAFTGTMSNSSSASSSGDEPRPTCSPKEFGMRKRR
jgi:hypothetical protein